MKIQIESSRVDQARATRTSLEERVRFVFRRMQQEIRQIRIALQDVNGPRGGVDKQCRLTVKLNGPGSLVVTSQGENTFAAFDNALERANRSLVRLWQRRHRPLRARSRLLASQDQESTLGRSSGTPPLAGLID